MKKTLFLISICSLAIFGLVGCGYTTRSMISDKYHTIYVQPFVNKINITDEAYTANQYKIYRPLLESDITKAVINKYIFDGNLKLAKDSTADLILKGEVVEFRKDALRYDSNNNVEEYRVSAVVNISLWDTRENKLVWKEDHFTGDASFFVLGSQTQSEDTAVHNALDDLARRVVERTVEQW